MYGEECFTGYTGKVDQIYTTCIIPLYNTTPYSTSGSSSDSSEPASVSSSCTDLRAAMSISLDPSTLRPFHMNPLAQFTNSQGIVLIIDIIIRSAAPPSLPSPWLPEKISHQCPWNHVSERQLLDYFGLISSTIQSIVASFFSNAQFLDSA
jgi:hypothetical protein